MRGLCILATASALALSAPALAVPYKFVVVDPGVMQNNVPIDGNSYTFFFDSMPTPVTSTTSSFSLTGSAYYTAGVYGSYRSDGDFDFFTGNVGFDTPLGLYFSEQLFTGDPSAPKFKLGTFVTDVGQITISAVDATPGAVPEPAAWSLMIAGFGLTGLALRARRTRVRVAA